jgi:hypothetical protein
VQKRKQRKNKTKFIKAEAERKANARERKRRSRAMTKERNELQKLEKGNISIFTVFGRWNNPFFLQIFNCWRLSTRNVGFHSSKPLYMRLWKCIF